MKNKSKPKILIKVYQGVAHVMCATIDCEVRVIDCDEHDSDSVIDETHNLRACTEKDFKQHAKEAGE